ncbi:D-aminoacyl-tRNA deacylase [Hutsoniella sourekii]|uniref:D-aminoacyl-tRNA deacylase n=1 Tax=Hutsoniella sourekii TaxID=87650 RepID=UPI00048810BF|nr:D-aminoacyl-tRNA deacylase [Hutsoniella sourekii]
MRVIIQKVSQGRVEIAGQVVGSINQGFVLLVGVCQEDSEEDVQYLARKISKMRIFEDKDGKTNLDLAAVEGQILSISQFTLYANTKKGNRPSFTRAGNPELAESLYLKLNQSLRDLGFDVEEGKFGADMQVYLVNDGPMTIILDSQNKDL